MKTAEEKTAENKSKNKGGQKTTYTFEIALRLFEEIAACRPIHLICQDDWAPSERTFYEWLHQFPEFAQGYARAREQQQERYAAEVIQIADTEPDPQRARNRMDARRWYAGKVSPKKWGDRVGVDVDAKVEISSAPSDALLQILAKLGTKNSG